MKKVFSMFLIASLFAASCSKNSHGSDDIITQQKHGGQEDNHGGGDGHNAVVVPDAVLAVFKARYPDATRIEWKQESDGNYKVEFYRGNVKWQAIFTKAGKLVKEEHD